MNWRVLLIWIASLSTWLHGTVISSTGSVACSNHLHHHNNKYEVLNQTSLFKVKVIMLHRTFYKSFVLMNSSGWREGVGAPRSLASHCNCGQFYRLCCRMVRDCTSNCLLTLFSFLSSWFSPLGFVQQRYQNGIPATLPVFIHAKIKLIFEPSTLQSGDCNFFTLDSILLQWLQQTPLPQMRPHFKFDQSYSQFFGYQRLGKSIYRIFLLFREFVNERWNLISNYTIVNSHKFHTRPGTVKFTDKNSKEA